MQRLSSRWSSRPRSHRGIAWKKNNQEYLRILNKYGIEYDERYVWD
jgi:hypothetical protein